MRPAWWRLWWVWAVPALLVVLNAVWLLGLRGALLGRGSLLARQVEELERGVTRLEEQKLRLTAASGDLATLQQDLRSLREEQLGRMGDRLVPFLVDVVQRAQEAGLQPERIGYSAEVEKASGLVHFTASYSLEGSYEQIRRCVYLLEESPQFIVLERLGLRGEESPTSLGVSIGLQVGTYFVEADEQLMRELGVRRGQ